MVLDPGSFFKNMFLKPLILTTFPLDILLYLTALKLCRLASQPVGKSDFDGNPVVSLDLGLRLGVCLYLSED